MLLLYITIIIQRPVHQYRTIVTRTPEGAKTP